MIIKLSIFISLFIASIYYNSYAGNVNIKSGSNSDTNKKQYLKKIKGNRMNIIGGGDINNRGLLEILFTFKVFPHLFKKLIQDCNVLDSGAGDCMLARQIFDDTGHFVSGDYNPKHHSHLTPDRITYEDYDQKIIDHANLVKDNKARINITSLSYSVPDNCPSYDNHTIIQCFFDDISNKKILEKSGCQSESKYDVIIDSFGCFHYAVDDKHRMEIIKRYRDLINDKGKIFIFSNTTLSDFIQFEKKQIEEQDISVTQFVIDDNKKIALIEKTSEVFEKSEAYPDEET